MHARGAIKAPYHIWVAIALTWIAGFVDIVGYVVLYRVFVANMTGNTIALGRGLAEGDWGLFLRGTLSNLADELVQYLVWFKAQTSAAGRFAHAVRASQAQPSFRAVCFLTGVWLSYCAGAALGAYLEHTWHLRSLGIPVTLLSVMIVSKVNRARQRALIA